MLVRSLFLDLPCFDLPCVGLFHASWAFVEVGCYHTAVELYQYTLGSCCSAREHDRNRRTAWCCRPQCVSLWCSCVCFDAAVAGAVEIDVLRSWCNAAACLVRSVDLLYMLYLYYNTSYHSYYTATATVVLMCTLYCCLLYHRVVPMILLLLYYYTTVCCTINTTVVLVL